MSSTTEDISGAIHRFVEHSQFSTAGGIVTDLDGTAVHEYQGKIVIPKQVELGLKALHEHGRPVVINTLRFPPSTNIVRPVT